MIEFSVSKVRNEVKDYLLLTLGVIIYCSAWSFFMIPNKMSSGGLTGLCTVLQYLTVGRIQVGVSYAAINVVLILVAFAFMGSKFGLKTIFCIVIVSLFLKFMPYLISLHSVEGSFMYVPEKFIIPLIAGLLEGLGLGIIFRNGGSTGGSDILALFVNKFWPVSPGRFFLVSDIVIVFSLLLVPGKAFSDLVYGFIMIIASSLTVDAVLVGGKNSVQMLVFSESYEEIADYVINNQERGVTAFEGMGWYTKKDRKILLILMQQKQVHEVTRAIHDIDRNALVSISPATNVYGEGFDKIRTGIKSIKPKR